MQVLLSRPSVRPTGRPIRPRHAGVRPTVRPSAIQPLARRCVMVRASSSDGEQAAKSLTETAALDEVIDRLIAAKSEQEVARVVAENIFSIDTNFWMRVATRNDTASSEEEKEKLADMANKVMVLVDAMVKKTEQQLEDSSQVLQNILTAAADEKGDWYLPLTKEQVDRVRSTMDVYSAQLDEALLSNAFAWINKCQQDSFDSMVQLIQKILQLYAAKQLRGAEEEGVEGVLNSVIYAEAEEWDGMIKENTASGVISEPVFMDALQRRMESVVLGLQSGSYAQRVQAEYLKELEARAKKTYKEMV